jgi:hypothetical protein
LCPDSGRKNNSPRAVAELLGADSKISTLLRIKRTLEVAGIEFIEQGVASMDGGPGVRLRGTKGKR